VTTTVMRQVPGQRPAKHRNFGLSEEANRKRRQRHHHRKAKHARNLHPAAELHHFTQAPFYRRLWLFSKYLTFF